MGNQLTCGCCAKEGGSIVDDRQDSRPFFCRKSCGLDELESDLFTCDPAGVFFEDTLAALDVKERLSFSFAGSSNLAALRWGFVHGANPKVSDSNGTTLLHVAARAGSFQIVKDLVLRSIDVNAVDCAGWTPLHVASCMGRQDVSLYLLQMGAKISRTARGFTPENLCSHPHTKEVVVGFEERRPKVPQVGLSLRATPNSEFVGPSAASEFGAGLHFEPFFVPREPVLHEPRHREELQQLGVSIFNRSPGHGVAFLVALSIVRDFPVEINNFLVRLNADPQKLGDYLSEEYPTAQTLRLEFLNSLPLLGTGVTTALEAISHDIRLPTDWLKVDRLLRGIAHFWWKQHEEELNDHREEGNQRAFHESEGELTGLELQRALLGTDGLHRLMFSTLMLHRWLSNDREMTLNEWVQLNMGIEGCGNDIPLHVQMGIYNAVSSRQLALQVASKANQLKPSEPTLHSAAFVRFHGRPQTDGDLAHWPQASPHVLAAEGGVLAAGRMSPQPHGADRPHKRPPLTTFAQPFDAGGSRLEEEMTWLRLHQWLLFLAPTDESAPFAFVSLKKAALLRADVRVLQIVLARRVEGEWPTTMVDDDWLELCLLLGDGRFQVLEAPELVMRFNDATEFQTWATYLREICSEDTERRRAALKLPPVQIDGAAP
ncbi:unnamed protein product [Durusdinium trenchii]|uniref:SEC7 domain-containing protein n=1 Tax=Durusdinium trenchii TaxID=1381693 RepID=A0ABP0JTZ5_9DINO